MNGGATTPVSPQSFALVLDVTSHADYVRARAGGKAWNLFRMQRAGLPVPPWVVLEPSFFLRYLDEAGLRGFVEEKVAVGYGQGIAVEADLLATLTQTRCSSDLRDDLLAARRRVLAPVVSVRSSAAAEDGGTHSFAGQHASFLDVADDAAVLQAIQACWASAFSDRSLFYRRQHGLGWQLEGLAVVLQQMVPSVASGVLFTCDPVRERSDRYLLHAVRGLGEGYVSGELDPDAWELDAETGAVLSFTAASGAADAVPVLDDKTVAALLDLARRVDALYQRPMDIEWAVDAQGVVWLLQARPVTTTVEPRHGRLYLWDNSNIVESYGGLTLPLTFHFAHYMYHHVYVQFCEVLGVDARDIRAMDSWLRNMLGIFHGRVYYNLLNWYKLTSILPGYKHNRAFMETMMGTRQSLDAEIAERIQPPAFHGGWRGRLARLRSGLRFLGYHFRIQGVVDDFQRYFYGHYERWMDITFSGMPADAILQHYHELENIMLWNWRAPIVNDYLCMVHFGIFQKLTKRWLGSLGENFHNDLLAGDGNLESAEPTRALIGMAGTVRTQPVLERLLMAYPDDQCLEALRQSPFTEFHEQVESYRRRYGFRCMSEMKLEQRDLHQRPGLLFAFLKNLLRNDQTNLEVYMRREQDLRGQAEAKMRAHLRGWKALVYRWSLKNARQAVRNRENTRFCRTRVYGIVRRMFWAMGEDLAGRGLLARDEDIFYLTLDELKGCLEGTNTVRDLKALVALRRAEYAVYAQEEPDARFATRGPVYGGNRHWSRTPPAPGPLPEGVALLGNGCCPGVVEGVVKVILDPDDDLSLQGEILVCARTDPGWIPLYPSISGLLVERGGLLSHSAIVAREMGLPAIVGIAGLTATLHNGMRVRMDGEKGTVEIL